MKTFATLLLAALAAAPAAAQVFPAKPIRLMVGLPAGGGADALARVVSTRLGERIGQPVLVENRTGANGLIAAEATAHSAPDGYTLLFGSTGSAFALLFQKLSYDPLKDFAPVSLVATVPTVLVVTPELPVKSVNEFIAYAKNNPGKIGYASSGNGSTLHLSMEMLKAMTGIDVVHVPYKGGVLAMNDLLSGRIQAMFEILPTQIANIRAGKVRALAVTTEKRIPQLPDLPALAETIPGFDAMVWYGVFAPAGVPTPVIARLNGELARVLEAPDVRERFTLMGAEPAHSTPERLDAFRKAELEKWTRVIKESGIKAD